MLLSTQEQLPVGHTTGVKGCTGGLASFCTLSTLRGFTTYLSFHIFITYIFESYLLFLCLVLSVVKYSTGPRDVKRF